MRLLCFGRRLGETWALHTSMHGLHCCYILLLMSLSKSASERCWWLDGIDARAWIQTYMNFNIHSCIVSVTALQFVEIAEIKDSQQHAGMISQCASCDCLTAWDVCRACGRWLSWMAPLILLNPLALQSYCGSCTMGDWHNKKTASLVSFHSGLGVAHPNHHLGTGRLHRLSRQVMKLEVVPDWQISHLSLWH